MIVDKITYGFVIQKWDTKKKVWVSQEFVAGDQCEYESPAGKSLDSDTIEDESGKEPYLPFDMVQPVSHK